MVATATPSVPALADDEIILWGRYVRVRSVTNRNALVEHYVRLAWTAVHQAKLPVHVGPDDISGVTMEALIWCVERFDPARGTRFTSWAYQRLTGAIKDYLRNWSRAHGWSRHVGRRAYVGRLDMLHGDDAGEHQQDVQVDLNADEAVVQVDAVDTVESVARLLPARMARIMRLRYNHDMTMRQIGETLGLSESRVCQVHGEAMHRLKSELHERVMAMVN